MEFVQALNPLYAIPIIAVIFCAFLVYAFGFKSPEPPPNFDGLENKKFSKKRKAKDIQKQNKLTSSGKTNGISSTKGKLLESPTKKESSDKSISSEKVSFNEKGLVEKKVSKKAKPQNDKKMPPERKKENGLNDDLNDGEWVQLLSKKVKKSRNKATSTVPDIDIQPTVSYSSKPLETKKFDDISHAKKPLKQVDLLTDVSIDDTKQLPDKISIEVNEKDALVISKQEKAANKIGSSVDHTAKKLKVTTPTHQTVLENSKKSELKKQSLLPENDVSETTTVKVISTSIPLQESSKCNVIVAPESNIDNTQTSKASDLKTNVVFDELAGLYPEIKEKKKKKVRRDH